MSSPVTPNKGTYPDYQFVNVSPERLERDLTAELKSHPSELKHWPWYHGNVARVLAEKLVHRDGDFLLRDCISSPGDFVLTCCSKGVPLHFVINSHVTEQDGTSTPQISYHFEDEQFSSIQDLIQFYMAHRKQVTKTSGSVITNPIARTMPLSYYDPKYGNRASLQGTSDYAFTPTQSPHASPYISPAGSPKSSPKSHHKRPVRSGSQPILSLDDDSHVILRREGSPLGERADSVPNVAKQFTSPLVKKDSVSIPKFHARAGSEPVLLPLGMYQEANRSAQYLNVPVDQVLAPSSSENSINKPPPPKPSRIPSIKYKEKPKIVVRNIDLYTDNDDRDYSDYAQVKESPSWVHSNHDNQQEHNNNVVNNNINNVNSGPHVPKRNHSNVHRNNSQYSNQQSNNIINNNNVKSDTSFRTSDKVQESQKLFSLPPTEFISSINISKFSCDILHEENKPLDSGALVSVKGLLFKSDAKLLALHLTKVDLDVLKVIDEHDLGMGVDSGLELLTLPHGKQIRQDIIER